MSSQDYIRSITEVIPDELPTLTPLSPDSPGLSRGSTNQLAINGSSFMNFFLNITWQTWVIIILILALLGINIFVYLAKGSQEIIVIFEQIFGPILKLFGYVTLSTANQVVQTSATGAKAGVDIVAGTTTGAINTLQQTSQNGLSTSMPQGQNANSTLPVQTNIQEGGVNIDNWQQDSLSKALENAKQSSNEISPDDSRSSIQTTGKSGWCYIGEEQGIRTCADIGVNDLCMSGEIFPTQEICMNPNLRA
jgi:hypothetical protein